MNRTRRIISILTALTCLLLYTLSPVYADEAAGSTDADSGTEVQTVEAADESSGTEIQPSESSDTGSEAEEEPAEALEEPTEASKEAGEAEESPSETAEEGLEAEEATAAPLEEEPKSEEPAQPVEIEKESGYSGSDVLNVIVPTRVTITIDPLELDGQGQIYSNIYNIINYGEVDVLLTFTDIKVTFSDDENFEALNQPFNERINSDLKSIYMLMNFGRADVPPTIITDPGRTGEISIPLSAAQNDAAETSRVLLNFSGSVNHLPEIPWQNDDVSISLTYTLETVPPPDEIIPASPEEEEVLDPEVEVAVPEAVDTAVPDAETAAPAVPEPESELTDAEASQVTPESDSSDESPPFESAPSNSDSPAQPGPSVSNPETGDSPDTTI